MNAPACEICGASVARGASVYRANAKGQPAIWRCIVHLEKLPDPELRRIVEIIEDGQ